MAGREEQRDGGGAALMAGITAGDAEALGRLYDVFGGLAYGLAQRMLHDATLAQEVVQDAFLAIWQNARRYDPERGSVRAWLLTVVHHRCVSVLRGRPARALEAPLEAEGIVTETDSVWRGVAERLDALDLKQALTDLPDEQHEVVRLAYFVGLTQQQISTQLDLPLGTVKGRMRLALRKLRDTLVSSHGQRQMAGEQ